MAEDARVEVMTSRDAGRRAGLLPWCCVSLLLLLCALGASTAEGATCLVDAATGNDMNMCCTTVMPCMTIQAAVNQATGGDTISVAAGTYPESAAGPLLINKTLILHGAQFGVDARSPRGAESIVKVSHGTSVSADNVVIDGFTIQDSTVAAFTGYGIWLNPTVSGTTVLNNIFQDNIVGLGIANDDAAHQLVVRHNLFQHNNQPGGASGTGIYTDQFVGGPTVTNVLIEENDFKMNNNSGIDLSNTCADGDPSPCAPMLNGVFNIEVRFNSFDMDGRAFDIFNTHGLMFHDNSVTNSTLAMSAALRIFDGNSDVTILNNNLIGGVANGIKLTNTGTGTLGPSSKVEIHLNNITPFDLDGLVVDPMSHVGSVNATCNWWGSATGPANPANPGGTGEAVVGDAIFDCWLIGLAPDAPCCVPTPTPTRTPTATPTRTQPSENGQPCTDPSQCQSMECVDKVCCDTACTEPNHSCDVPGREGTCLEITAAPTPTLSTVGELVGFAMLMLVAAAGLYRGRLRH